MEVSPFEHASIFVFCWRSVNLIRQFKKAGLKIEINFLFISKLLNKYSHVSQYDQTYVTVHAQQVWLFEFIVWEM